MSYDRVGGLAGWWWLAWTADQRSSLASQPVNM